jgi:hypothetical protein
MVHVYVFTKLSLEATVVYLYLSQEIEVKYLKSRNR